MQPKQFGLYFKGLLGRLNEMVHAEHVGDAWHVRNIQLR